MKQANGPDHPRWVYRAAEPDADRLAARPHAGYLVVGLGQNTSCNNPPVLTPSRRESSRVEARMYIFADRFDISTTFS